MSRVCEMSFFGADMKYKLIPQHRVKTPQIDKSAAVSSRPFA